MAATGFSDFAENKLLDHIFRNTAYTPPAAVYGALMTVAPNDDGTGGTEVTGGSYARKAVTFGAASGGQLSNSADLVYDQATAQWGTIVGVAIYDAVTAGNFLFWCLLVDPGDLVTPAPKLIDTGDIGKFLAGTLRASLD